MDNFDVDNLETWSLEQLRLLLAEKEKEQIEEMYQEMKIQMKRIKRMEDELQRKLDRLSMKAPDQGFRLVIEDENEKLKEENKYLSDLRTTMNKSYNEIIDDRNDTIQELKKDQLYYRLYLHTVDPDGDCSPNKEDVDRFTHDPVMRKNLYERIGYDEE